MIDINLQLFAGDEENDTRGEKLPDEMFENWEDEDGEDNEEADDEGLGNDDDDTDGETEEEDETEDEEESVENQEVADPDKSRKSKKTDEDAIYAKLRRKAETEAADKLRREKEDLEALRYQVEQEKRLNSISQEQIWQKADEEGVSEEAARKMLQLEERARMLEERENAIKRNDENKKQKDKLRKELYFNELETDIDKFIGQFPETTVEGAFHYLRSTKLPELMAGKVKAAKKSTIADLHDRARRSGVSASDAGQAEDINPRTILSKADLDLCEAFGTDPKKIARRVKTHLKNKKG